MPLRTGAATDTGRQRTSNEDALLCKPETGIFAVIDGVGGYAGGEVAAALAREAISRRLDHRTDEPEQDLREAVTNANNKIYWQSQEDPNLAQMACVLTVAIVSDHRVMAAHVGDTRLYKIRHQAIEKLTRDHSFVGVQEDEESLSEADAMQHPRRNEILRDVGSDLHDPNDAHFIDIISESLEPDAALLLCTDGLTDLVRSSELTRIIHEHAGHPQAAAEALIQAANEAGGKDNITVIVVEGRAFGTGNLVSSRTPPARLPANGDTGERPRYVPSPASTPPPVAITPARPVPPASPSRPPTTHPAAASLPPPRWRYFGFGGLTMLALIAAAYLVWRLWPAGATIPAPDTPIASADTTASLNERLAQASPGSTVWVKPGYYPETIRLREGVTLKSTEGGQAYLAPTPGDSVAVIADGITGATLAGFRIGPDTTQSHLLATGIRIRDAGVTIETITLTGATAAGIDIETHVNEPVVIRQNEVETETGAGIIVHSGGANVQLTNNTIRIKGGVGILMLPGTAPLVRHNMLRGAGTGIELRMDPRALQSALDSTNSFNLDAPTGSNTTVRVTTANTPAPR